MLSCTLSLSLFTLSILSRAFLSSVPFFYLFGLRPCGKHNQPAVLAQNGDLPKSEQYERLDLIFDFPVRTSLSAVEHVLSVGNKGGKEERSEGRSFRDKMHSRKIVGANTEKT